MHAAHHSTPQLPNRLCEDWRFGAPHRHAATLAQMMQEGACRGSITVEGADDALAKWEACGVRSIGSDALLALRQAPEGVCVRLEHDYAEPITITCETDGVFTPAVHIVARAGVHAHIIERHICRGEHSAMVCARRIVAEEGAQLSVELQEEGSGTSRVLNITDITARGACVRHLTTHANHEWAREETTAEALGNAADIQLFSANRLEGSQMLDQHTRQLHSDRGCASNLLYKNVLDARATAVFAGNIYVAPGAHDTDAYQSNRNMLLSENATVHSLPGLEILADRVRCSHGSASAPMDAEQLFYLLSRGIPRHQAQLLVAEGFLNDVHTRFQAE